MITILIIVHQKEEILLLIKYIYCQLMKLVIQFLDLTLNMMNQQKQEKQQILVIFLHI